MNEITIVNHEETKVKKLSNKQREMNLARDLHEIKVSESYIEALDTL